LEIQAKLEKLLSKLHSDDEWGTYFIGKYYFTIATQRERAYYGLTKPKQKLSIEAQLQLQREHFPAIFHEYIHYLHELSTVLGNASLSLDLSAKAIFSNWLDSNPKAGTSKGLKPEYSEKYAKVLITQDIFMGDFNDVIEGRFLQVTNIDYVKQEAHFPIGTEFEKIELNIPSINFEQMVDGKLKVNKLLFGKYFIYEGLAYELDRLVDMQVNNLKKITDDAKGTEYTVLRRVAQYILPSIDKRTFLSLGVLSLQYLDCGATFINWVENVKQNEENGISQPDSLQEIKNDVISLLESKRQNFQDAQDEYVEIFKSRRNLHQSFVYLADQMKKLYDERINNPCFDVDYVLDGRFMDILDIVQICDYMYLFTDKDEFMRDFLGTSIDEDTSQALKSVVCYDHYYKKHMIHPTSQVETESHQCPFYTCCDLELRKTNANVCQTKPWRIYEIAANKDNQQCWYGSGLLEFKGHNENTKAIP